MHGYLSQELDEGDMEPAIDYSPERYYSHDSPENNTFYASQSRGGVRPTQSPSYNLPASVPVKSEEIMSMVFDEDLSIHSPSRRKKLKMLQNQITASSREEASGITRGTVDRLSVKKFSNYHEEFNPFVEKASKLRGSAEQVAEPELGTEEKVIKYAECLSSPSKEVQLAGLQGLYELIENNQLNPSITEVVVDEILSSLEKWDEFEPDFVECSLEILATIGTHPLTLQRIPLIASMVVHDETSDSPSVHQAAFGCLCRLGFPGVDALVRLAAKDYAYLQHWILDKLACTNAIQRHLIVPALTQNALSTDSNLRTSAVAALNRMYSLTWEGGALPVLLTLMEEGSVDRQLLACSIRACGTIGEQTLIKLLRHSDNPKIRMAAAGCLCWRVPPRPRQLEIRIVSESMIYDYHRFPGSMCSYLGPLSPVIFQAEPEDSVLEISARDFLSSLQRWVRRENEDELGDVFPHLPSLPKVMETSGEEKAAVSLQAVHALAAAVKDEFEGVRETATYALGFIGLPEASEAASALARLLKDPSSQVRTMACWAVGRLGPSAWKAAGALIDLLRDGYWKVRTAACIALASAGQNLASKSLPILYKILRDGSINRGTVAETIVRLGANGERLLIDILNNEPHSNGAMRTGIVKALAHSNVYHNNIDFVVETLFKLSNDRMPNIRKEVLLTLSSLSGKANNQVTYLKARTLLPLFFRFLRDAHSDVKGTALKCMVAVGPQAQLMLIEALTKDQNPHIRVQAAKGLGLFGPSTFRTLLLGLHDTSPMVRKAAANTISKNFTVDAISDEFWEKIAQRQSIRCTIKEILKLTYPLPQACALLFKELLGMLDQEFATGGRGEEYMDSHPELRVKEEF